jgi:hypothetical protein
VPSHGSSHRDKDLFSPSSSFKGFVKLSELNFISFAFSNSLNTPDIIETFEIIAKAAPSHKLAKTLSSTSNHRILITGWLGGTIIDHRKATPPV